MKFLIQIVTLIALTNTTHARNKPKAMAPPGTSNRFPDDGLVDAVFAAPFGRP